MTEKATQIVILGAGYAGLMCTTRMARYLRHTSGAQITLISEWDQYVERLRLHQYAANQDIKHHSVSKVLKNTGALFVQGRVTKLDLNRQLIDVTTPEGTRQVSYDKLVYALGSTIDRDSVPGVRENAYVLTSEGDRSAKALQTVLPALNAAKGKLLIVGGGATGIEAAAEFAESFPDLQVELVTRGRVGDFINNKVAEYMRNSIMRLGVKVHEDITITALRSDEAVTKQGDTISYDVCLWTGGFSVPPLAKDSGLLVNDRGQIWVDPYLRSTSHPNVFGCGDAAFPREEPGVRFRMSAYTALVSGGFAAECVSRTVKKKSLHPFSFAYYGQAIALGRHDAIGFNICPADKVTAPYLTGRVGYWFREFFATFAGAVPRLERRYPVLFWLGRGRYAAQKRRAGTPQIKPSVQG